MGAKQSKKTQKNRKGNKGQKRTQSQSSKKSGGLSQLQVGLAVIVMLLALAGAYFLSSSKRAALMSSPPEAENLDVWEWDTSKVAQYVRRQGKQFKRFAVVIEKNELTGAQV